MSDCSTHAFDAPELLPCPFCGGEIRVKRYGDGMSSLDMYHEKGCVMREDLENGSFDRDDLPDVLAAWNTRAERECEDLYPHLLYTFRCSECHFGMDYPGISEYVRYCPNCGARVRG